MVRLHHVLFILLVGTIIFPARANAISDIDCYALGGSACYHDSCGSGAAGSAPVSHGTCIDNITNNPIGNCCQTAAAAVPPPSGTTAIPDTNCPADSTYVALTDSCISVSDFNNFLFNLLILAGVLVAIYRATTGFFMFMTAEGSPEKLQSGREALTQAMVGLLIVVAGWVFIRLFETILPDAWNIILTGA